MNSYDHYKNLREEDASSFDQQWQSMASQMGFKPVNNALGYGGDNRLGRSNSHAARGIGYDDEARRGHYMPEDARAEYQ